MADERLTDRTALGAAPASGDLLHVVDVSDTTDNASGTSKKITADNFTSYGDARTATLTNKTINTASNTITVLEADVSDLQAYITSVLADTTPQLGGNLDVNGNSIVSVSAGNIAITPDTTGSVVLDGLSWPQADGTNGQFLTTDGAGNLSFGTPAGSGDVSKVGTPVDSQIGVWTGDGTIEGDADFTFDTATNTFALAGSAGTSILAQGGVNVLVDSPRGTMTLSNIDALDATTEATIEAAIDTLANLTAAAALVTVGTLTTGNADAIVSAASTTTAGKIEVATAAETTTGTDATRAVSPDGLAGSIHGKKSIQMVVFDFTTDTATGDGKFYFHVPASLAGFNIIAVHAEVITAGTTGTTDIQLHNVTAAADILSTKITIDSTETGSDTAATPAVINTAEDDLTENDLIRVDVDAVSTTAAKGLIVTLDCQLP